MTSWHNDVCRTRDWIELITRVDHDGETVTFRGGQFSVLACHACNDSFQYPSAPASNTRWPASGNSVCMLIG
jgi:hypothetical protein